MTLPSRRHTIGEDLSLRFFFAKNLRRPLEATEQRELRCSTAPARDTRLLRHTRASRKITKRIGCCSQWRKHFRFRRTIPKRSPERPSVELTRGTLLRRVDRRGGRGQISLRCVQPPSRFVAAAGDQGKQITRAGRN